MRCACCYSSSSGVGPHSDDLDKGIASLLRYPTHEHGGTVQFRPDESGRQSVLSFIRSRLGCLLELELVGRLTVVGPTRIRIR
jgi:hypothetical protein